MPNLFRTIIFTLNTLGYIGSCLCTITSQYYDGSTCVPCHGSCLTCSGGLNTNCLTCASPAVINNSNSSCNCPVNSFMNATFQCVCSTGQYLSLSGTTYSCLVCNSICLNCTDSTSNNCTACTFPLILSGTTCICSSSGYTDLKSGSCLACDPTCLTCTGGLSTECLTCDASLHRVINGTRCSCSMPALEVNQPMCQLNVCSNGYANISDVCVVICGDGIVINEACDDGNTISGDGCSSTCTIEADYTCVNHTGAATTCSYNKPL
jgi:proprotein convertase subtilisin/kexin type 5